MKHYLLGAITLLMLTLTGCGALDDLILTETVSIYFSYTCLGDEDVNYPVSVTIDGVYLGSTQYTLGKTTYWTVPIRGSHRVELLLGGSNQRISTLTTSNRITIRCN